MATIVGEFSEATHTQPSLQEVARQHGIHKLALTSEGYRLEEEHPEALQSFLQAAKVFAGREIDTTTYPTIGNGQFSATHGIAAIPDVCIKVSNSTTQGNRAYYSGMPNTPVATPSLLAEAQLMHQLGHRLARRQQGVHAPRVYGVAKAGTTQVMLQTKIPEGFTQLSDAVESIDGTANEAAAYKATLKRRVINAVGITPLRFGIGDLTNAYSTKINSGNVFIDNPNDPETTEIYVIDLMGPRFSRAVAARLFGSLR